MAFGKTSFSKMASHVFCKKGTIKTSRKSAFVAKEKSFLSLLKKTWVNFKNEVDQQHVESDLVQPTNDRKRSIYKNDFDWGVGECALAATWVCEVRHRERDIAFSEERGESYWLCVRLLESECWCVCVCASKCARVISEWTCVLMCEKGWQRREAKAQDRLRERGKMWQNERWW